MATEQSKIELEIVTPAEVFFTDTADMVVVPGGEGDFGILCGHAPLLSQVRAGTIDIFDGGRISAKIFVEGRIADVTDDRCTVLVETAIMVSDIDKSLATERLRKAREAQDSNKEHVMGIDSHELIVAQAQVDATDS